MQKTKVARNVIFGAGIFHHKGEDTNEIVFKTFVPTGMFAVFGAEIIGLSYAPGWVWLFIYIPVIIFLMLWPQLGRLDPLYGIEDEHTYRSGGHKLREEAEEFLWLPSADQALYPHNLIETLKDPDLTLQNKTILSNSMRDIRDKIDERNKVRAELSRRNVDVSGIVDGMNDSVRSIEIETDTYREFLSKD